MGMGSVDLHEYQTNLLCRSPEDVLGAGHAHSRMGPTEEEVWLHRAAALEEEIGGDESPGNSQASTLTLEPHAAVRISLSP